jgi:hypothetical protein
MGSQLGRNRSAVSAASTGHQPSAPRRAGRPGIYLSRRSLLHEARWVRGLRFLLARPEWGYRGSRASLWFLVGLTVLTTAQSLIHVLETR